MYVLEKQLEIQLNPNEKFLEARFLEGLIGTMRDDWAEKNLTDSEFAHLVDDALCY